MAAKDPVSGGIRKQELDDMTTCCICTEVFTDPKALPCIHTFCMKCLSENGLKNNKGPGDEMPCPICRRMFKIPSDGFRGLPKNFFIEKLIQASNISDHSVFSRGLCDACLDEHNKEDGEEIPVADAYCIECKCKLCETCGNEHRKLKFTKNHKLIQINEHEGGQKMRTELLHNNVCELHEENIPNVFCADCKTVVCAICFIDNHKNHEGSHVNKFVDGFRKQMENNAEALNECKIQALKQKAELLQVTEDAQKSVETLECNIKSRTDEVKQFADKHANSLVQGLYLIRQSKLKEIQMITGDIDTYISSLETFNSYSQKIMTEGSASDICRSFSDLSVRAVDLQGQYKPSTEREIQPFNYHFRKSELEEVLKETCENLIGEIQEEGDSKPKKRGKQNLPADENNEIGILRKEIETERTEKENLRLLNEQLMIDINKEMQANKALKEVLKVSHDSLETNIDQLKQELEHDKTVKSSVQTHKEKLKQDVDTEQFTNNSHNASCSNLVQEVTMCKMTIKTLEDNVEKLKQELETRKTGKLRCISHPALVETIITKAAEEKGKCIRGLTLLDNELFVVSEKSSEVEVYDSTKLSFSCRFNLMDLFDPNDIVCCNRNKCLYIFDFRIRVQSAKIFRVDPHGKLIRTWLAGDGNIEGNLSVTDESNIILTVSNRSSLKEYSPDGQLVREIVLSPDANIRNPMHAIKLANGHFVVSHGSNLGLHRVCVVDADGRLKKSFGRRCGSATGQLNFPVYLSVDGNGFVMVADRDNNQIVLLDSNLDFKRVILSKAEQHQLRYPFRILLDESNGRLLVADNGWDSKKRKFADGRFLIFNL